MEIGAHTVVIDPLVRTHKYRSLFALMHTCNYSLNSHPLINLITMKEQGGGKNQCNCAAFKD